MGSAYLSPYLAARVEQAGAAGAPANCQRPGFARFCPSRSPQLVFMCSSAHAFLEFTLRPTGAFMPNGCKVGHPLGGCRLHILDGSV